MKFSISDLFIVTFITAAAISFSLVLSRLMEAPWWVAVSTGLTLTCCTVGMLVGQFRGGVIGALIGGCLGVLWMLGYTGLALLHVIRV